MVARIPESSSTRSSGSTGAPSFEAGFETGVNYFRDPGGRLDWNYQINPTTRELTQWHPVHSDPNNAFQNGPIQNFNIGVSGGSERIKYYLSGSTGQEEGYVDWNTQYRTNLRGNLDAVLAYMSRLEGTQRLVDVVLASHEIKVKEPGQPVEFGVDGCDQIVERSRVVDSDGETLAALAAARGGLDVLTHTRWLEILGRESVTRRFYRSLERVVHVGDESFAVLLGDDLMVDDALVLKGIQTRGVPLAAREYRPPQGFGQLVRLGTERGRSANENLKVGVCGEHGGDPDSIRFFRSCGLNYVSCSPYRVPVARLAAAQAELEQKHYEG